MLELIRSLAISNTTKIVLMSLDGLGGLPRPETGKSELETARVPNLTALASEAACGLVAARGAGDHAGQRAGAPRVVRLRSPRLPGRPRRSRVAGYRVRSARRRRGRARQLLHRRCALGSSPIGARDGSRRKPRSVWSIGSRRSGCRESKSWSSRSRSTASCWCCAAAASRDGSPRPIRRRSGKPPIPVKALEPAAARTAELVNAFVDQARRLLADAAPANMVLLRGFDALPELPRFPEVYGLRAAAIAAYPMYRGLAKLVGMDVIKTGATFADEITTLREHWQAYDFFFVHYKDTDKAGEDGKFDAKVEALERFDAFIPAVRALGPDVLVVTGDHATPSVLAGHGWQPVPVLDLEPVLRRGPGHRVRRARLRGGHAGGAASASPDVAGHGQRAEAHEVRRVVTVDAISDPSPRCALAGHAGRQRRVRLVRGDRGAHAAGRGPPAPGRARRRRRARGLRAAGGPRRPHRLRARVHPLQPARSRDRDLRRLRLGHRRHSLRQDPPRPDHPARYRYYPAQRSRPQILHRGGPADAGVRGAAAAGGARDRRRRRACSTPSSSS